MKILTIFLRFTLCIMLFLVSVICYRSFPALLVFMYESYTSLLVVITYGILLYASGICTYGIIFFAWRLLYLTDHRKLLSNSGIFAVRMIKIFFYSIAILYVTSIFGVIAETRIIKAPAPLTIELFLIILGSTIGAFSNVLQKIMQNEVAK